MQARGWLGRKLREREEGIHGTGASNQYSQYLHDDGDGDDEDEDGDDETDDEYCFIN